MTHGGKVPEIAKMLTELTGRSFEHRDVFNVVQKLEKRCLVTDTQQQQPRKKNLNSGGLQVPPEGLGLYQYIP